MKGKELRALLTPETDELEVMVMVENHLKPGMFAFAPACPDNTGISKLGPDENMENEGEEVFLVLPHNAGVPEDEVDETIPELN
jgi:hypothetical protein